MSLPILSATEPTVVPAKIFDKWWIQNINIQAFNPNADANASVTLVKFSTDENGVATMSQEFTTLELENLLSNAQNDPELAAVMVGLMNYVMKIGQQKGIISAPSDTGV